VCTTNSQITCRILEIEWPALVYHHHHHHHHIISYNRNQGEAVNVPEVNIVEDGTGALKTEDRKMQTNKSINQRIYIAQRHNVSNALYSVVLILSK